jgi:Xaa-Pro aminopeptidase
MAKPHKQLSRRWPGQLAGRVAKLRARIAGQGAAAMLLSNASDIRYLTGFTGEDSWALVTRRGVTAISDRRFEEELATGTPHLRAVMRKESLAEELGRELRAARVKKLIVQAEHVTLTQRASIGRYCRGVKLVPVSGWLLEQRAVKDDSEVAHIEEAIAIQQAAFTQLKGQLKVGMAERQVCAQLEFNMRRLGADGPAFRTIVGVGANSSIPHYHPGDFKVKRNEPLLIDFGAVVHGYHSDMTRVIVLGKLSRKMVEVYEVVREAQAAGIAAIAPGKKLADVDAAARKVIKAAGYGKQFGHGLGHGIGLQIHEEPRLSWAAEGVLEMGHVVTVEPGIYLPGVGGVRLEDDVLVTERGGRNLCTLPTDLESAMI